MADDRKYGHRGYMDSGRESGPKSRAPRENDRTTTPGAPRGRSAGVEKDLAVVCKSCGYAAPALDETRVDSVCRRCAQPLHACRQCRFFEPSAPRECLESARIPARVADKAAKNDCPVFSPATSFDLTGRKAADSPADARSAFDALFKK
ncbi:MAG: hypothetical protein ACRD16_16260 [Thermoanaerobaculia bacterium]